MFICDTCLEKSYENDPSLRRSFGACEFCDEVKMCSDIHHSLLVPIQGQDGSGLEGERSEDH